MDPQPIGIYEMIVPGGISTCAYICVCVRVCACVCLSLCINWCAHVHSHRHIYLDLPRIKDRFQHDVSNAKKIS